MFKVDSLRKEEGKQIQKRKGEGNNKWTVQNIKYLIKPLN